MKLLLPKAKQDTAFAQLLERWVSGDTQERAQVQESLFAYSEAFAVQMQLALQNKRHKDAAEQFLKECEDPRIIEWLSKQATSGAGKIALTLAFLPATIMFVFCLFVFLMLPFRHLLHDIAVLLLFAVLVFCQFKTTLSIMNMVQKVLVKHHSMEALERVILAKGDPRLLQALCATIPSLKPGKWSHWKQFSVMVSRITEADRPFFPKQTIQMLFNLAPYMPEEVLCDFCLAFAHIGDSSHIPALLALARTSKSAQVKEAAQHCIATLQSANDIAQEPATLLRASNATEQTDTLLRPAQHTNDDDTNQLLRPR